MEAPKVPAAGRKRFAALWVGLLSLAGIGCSLLVLYLPVRRWIIRLAEEYLIHRKVNFYDDWINTLAAWGRSAIALILAVDFFVLTQKGRTLFREIRGEMRDCLGEIDRRALVKPFLLIAGVYLLALTSLIRADYLYADDVGRAFRGYHGWNGWSRHLPEFVSTLLHADNNLADISPLPQILAVLLCAGGGVLLTLVLGGGIAWAPLLAALPLGLSPYFLECLSYKFDAPYMALAVLAGIVPFLFVKAKRAFVFASVAGLLIMCVSYQAASGVYALIAAILLFNDWNRGRKTNRELVSFALRAALSYAAALILFRLIFMVAGTTGHGTSTAALTPARLIPGVLRNLARYASTINQDFGLAWKAGSVLVCLLFVVNAIQQSARRGVLRFVVPPLALVLFFALSYGAYLALESPLYAPRSLLGFGVLLAAAGVCLVSSPGKKAAFLCVMALNWCFFVFALSYGNALADQKRYNDFRVQRLLSDLSILFPYRTASSMAVHLENTTGFGPFTENIARHYPVIKRIIPGSRHYHTYRYLNDYFHWREGEPWDGGSLDLPVVLDTYYHTIKSDGTHISVVFKDP
ncbi:MAG: glucosyltransferase domain-containing protein [Treponema sp.]|jgi:hypothetical protein|nr:glucosyltransferase domain-containing protein [Treponema sp.]